MNGLAKLDYPSTYSPPGTVTPWVVPDFYYGNDSKLDLPSTAEDFAKLAEAEGDLSAIVTPVGLAPYRFRDIANETVGAASQESLSFGQVPNGWIYMIERITARMNGAFGSSGRLAFRTGDYWLDLGEFVLSDPVPSSASIAGATSDESSPIMAQSGDILRLVVANDAATDIDVICYLQAQAIPV